MVGFVGALIGGAMSGFGKGQMEEIKQKREEKLKDLDRQFQTEQGALNRAVQEKQIASTEKLTLAQQATQEKIANLNAATQIKTTEIGEGGANARTKAQIESAEKQNRENITSAKDLAEFKAASDQALNSRLTAVTKDGKTTYEYLTPDGTKIPKLKGPDGKEYDWAGPDANTDAAKNYNFMIANGFDPTKAGQLAFGAKDGDIESMTAQFYDSFVKSSFVTPDETKSQQFMKMARDAAVSIANGGKAAPAPAAPVAPAAGTPDAATPAVPSSSGGDPAKPAAEPDLSKVKRPPDMDDAAIIAAVKADPGYARKDPAMVRKLLIDGYKVSPDAVRAAGL